MEEDWKAMLDRSTAEHKMLHTTSRAVKEMMANAEHGNFDSLENFFEVGIVKQCILLSDC